jgi:hypothetical protein
LAEQIGLTTKNNVMAREAISGKRVKLAKLNSNEKAKKSTELKKRVTDRANGLLDKFKQSMQLSRQIPEQERVRQKIRENFFFSVIYGFEELRLKYDSEPESFGIFPPLTAPKNS